MKEIIVTNHEAGQRLDKLLMKRLNKAPGSFIYKMLRKKNIVLNGRKSSGSEKVEDGDIIRMYLSDDTIDKFSVAVSLGYHVPDIETVYEDENIILINKPAGVLSQKAAYGDISVNEMLASHLIKNGETTEEQMKGYRPSVCHRLDRNTSGLMAAGKNIAAQQELSEIFKNRTAEKYYLCIVQGEVACRGKVEGWITKDRQANKAEVLKVKTDGAEFIQTEYVPVRTGKNHTLMEVRLITGRTHQIRAQFAALGHPAVGDYKYGSRAANDIYKEKYGVQHQLLHSYRLVFPKSGCKKLEYLHGAEFRAPLPDIFSDIIRDIEVDNEIYGDF